MCWHTFLLTPANREDAVKQLCNVKMELENAGEGWSQPEPLGTGAAFGNRGLVLKYQPPMESAGGFLLQGAERLGTHVGHRGRTHPLEPAWDWCVFPESHPGMWKRLPRNETPPCTSPAVSETPSNTVSFEVEEGSALFLGSIVTRCWVMATLSLSALSLPLPPALPDLQRWQLREEGGSSPLPAAGGWICAPPAAQEACPAAPPPPGNRWARWGTPLIAGPRIPVFHRPTAQSCCCLRVQHSQDVPLPGIDVPGLLASTLLFESPVPSDVGFSFHLNHSVWLWSTMELWFFRSRQPAGNRRSLNKREALVTTSLLFTVPSSREVKRQWMKWRINHA